MSVVNLLSVVEFASVHIKTNINPAYVVKECLKIDIMEREKYSKG